MWLTPHVSKSRPRLRPNNFFITVTEAGKFRELRLEIETRSETENFLK